MRPQEEFHAISVRELQLLRETLAAMKLRGSVRHCRTGTMRRESAAADVSTIREVSGAAGAVRILLIGEHERLLMSRELLLGQAGYDTESCPRSVCLDRTAVQRFDIAILCHSIAQETAMRIADLLHRYHPAICVLRLTPSGRSGLPHFDRELDDFASPEQLLRAVSEEASRLLEVSDPRR